ncbi:hypothetical protein TWF192_007479 [Orbilia oligospora]|nr:hypothetical protein TWF192_007479 [Orbilia oligospora]
MNEKKTKESRQDSIFPILPVKLLSGSLAREREKRKRRRPDGLLSPKISTTNERRQLPSQKMRDTNGVCTYVWIPTLDVWLLRENVAAQSHGLEQTRLVCTYGAPSSSLVLGTLHTTSPPASLYLIQPAGAA